jgi:hypothetical protein
MHDELLAPVRAARAKASGTVMTQLPGGHGLRRPNLTR